jgi:transcription elongation factor GreB
MAPQVFCTFYHRQIAKIKQLTASSTFFPNFVVSHLLQYNTIMSRGFVKEEDQEEVPMVPPRAFLPQGVPNYVTRMGMDALLRERDEMLRERDELTTSNEQERRLAVNHLIARQKLLDERIATARVMEPTDPPPPEIRFGAKIIIYNLSTKETQIIQIVGVDEADPGSGKISFISPLAKALNNKKAGEKAILKLPAGEKVFEIKTVSYD